MSRLLSFFLLVSIACAEDFDAAREVIRKAVAKGKPPGAVLVIESGGKTMTLVEGQRAIVPAKEPMTEDTIFDAASLTKVTATLPSVMLLIEQGKIELEAEVRRYIPEMRPAITVRHLLTHTFRKNRRGAVMTRGSSWPSNWSPMARPTVSSAIQTSISSCSARSCGASAACGSTNSLLKTCSRR